VLSGEITTGPENMGFVSVDPIRLNKYTIFNMMDYVCDQNIMNNE
jgi:hypothetical protein